MSDDEVNHPKHYNSHGSGVECIDVVEHMNFNLGNAIKYVWRAGLKSPDDVKDLKKAIWYLEREVQRLMNERIAKNVKTGTIDATQVKHVRRGWIKDTMPRE
jgi:hypothetical protein